MTPKDVRRLLDYNPETGKFVWRRRLLRDGLERIDKGWNSRFAGVQVADRRHRHGHLQIGLHCKNYMAHRLAWAHYYDEWPETDIDHIDGNPGNNRINNLRMASDSQNLCNSKVRADNTSGTKGVSWSRKHKKWYAYINKDQKMINLGLYSDLGDAIAARLAGEVMYHGEFARVK